MSGGAVGHGRGARTGSLLYLIRPARIMFKFRTGQAYKGSGIADLPGSSPASGADPQAGSRGPGRVRTRIPDTQQCDDGNAANGDGCSSTCQINPGFNCVGSPSVCSTICGEGIMAATNPATTAMQSLAMAAPACALSNSATCAPAVRAYASTYRDVARWNRHCLLTRRAVLSSVRRFAPSIRKP